MLKDLLRGWQLGCCKVLQFFLGCHFENLLIRIGQKYFRFILPQEDAASWKDRWQLVYIEDMSTG